MDTGKLTALENAAATITEQLMMFNDKNLSSLELDALHNIEAQASYIQKEIHLARINSSEEIMLFK